MSRKLIFIVLMFSLISTSYGEYIIGDWENSGSGWEDDGLDGWSGTNNELYPGQTVGVTHGVGSLLMIGPTDPCMATSLWYDGGPDAGARAAMLGNTHIRIDVTRPMGYWVEDSDPNTVATSTFTVVVQGGGPTGGMFGTFQQWDADGLCEWNGTDETQTIVFDYPEVVDTEYWMQIVITPHVEGYAQSGTYYFDYARIVPEPMTIALLGIGGLGLLRRKR
ncbi:MAG: PEP-CTERM sorting domain-containing protein [Phycisphaerae bacterium]|jgi:hypothetical protein